MGSVCPCVDGTTEPSLTYSCVIGFDVNGTIIEGDSFHEGGAEAVLTQPAQDLLGVLKDTPARILLYTFGRDFDVVVGLMQQQGYTFPECNYYFIARARQGEEIWAFPMNKARPSRHVNFAVENGNKGNPVITTALEELLGIELIQEIGDLGIGKDAEADVYRFKNTCVFEGFVEMVLSRGHAVFRACYDSTNEYFCRRKDSKNKVLASSVPALAFDDNDQDWELCSSTCTAADLKVLHVVSPLAAERLNAGKADPDVLRQQQKFQPEAPPFKGTDFVVEFDAFLNRQDTVDAALGQS